MIFREKTTEELDKESVEEKERILNEWKDSIVTNLIGLSQEVFKLKHRLKTIEENQDLLLYNLKQKGYIE